MSRKEQKNQELAHLLAFKESIPDFPEGEIPKDKEHPDFPISTSNKIVGIEHTEVFHEPRKNGTTMQAEENYIFQILNKSKRLFDSSNNEPVVVWVSFSIGTQFSKRQIDSIAKALVQRVKNNIPEQNETIKIRQTWEADDPLPKEITSITVIRFENREKSGWAPVSLGGAIPEIPFNFIQESINRKNQKVSNYRIKCDEFGCSSLFMDSYHQHGLTFQEVL
ncbi:MAG: hypothetical protein WD059_07950 [Balneolaceae bacterium]